MAGKLGDHHAGQLKRESAEVKAGGSFKKSLSACGGMLAN